MNEFLTIGAGIIVPLAQEYLNKYIPSKFRLLTVWMLALILGTIIVVIQGKESFSIEYLIGHFGVIGVISQGIYFYLIKQK